MLNLHCAKFKTTFWINQINFRGRIIKTKKGSNPPIINTVSR